MNIRLCDTTRVEENQGVTLGCLTFRSHLDPAKTGADQIFSKRFAKFFEEFWHRDTDGRAKTGQAQALSNATRISHDETLASRPIRC